jgi:hypothetical protein
MTAEPPTAQSERRSFDREPMEGTVTVRFAEQEIVGPGQNMSDEGVFFVADGALRVKIQVDGRGTWREGEVVRVQSMGEGRLGMAIRFS